MIIYFHTDSRKCSNTCSTLDKNMDCNAISVQQFSNACTCLFIHIHMHNKLQVKGKKMKV